MGTALIKKFFSEYRIYQEKIMQFLLSQKFKSAMALKISHLLLNRLLYLCFLQGHNWNIELPKVGECATVYKKSGEKGVFFQKWLKFLFNQFLYEAEPADPDSHFDFKVKIFKSSELDKAEFRLSDDLLLDVIENFFGQFQFTISEQEANNQEDVIDPTILGSIYESVIVGEQRGSDGIFYTPKPEVDFMCRIALYEYLVRKNPTHIQLLFDFVFIPKSHLVKDKTLPFNKLRENLGTMKILDPACGSGAFLIGMFHAIVELYKKLHGQVSFESKQNIICSILYGIDINDWAIQAAIYRLWLALLATEETHPLNTERNLGLSFNLQVGDSLLQPMNEKFDIIITNPPYVNRNLILPPSIDSRKKNGLSKKNIDIQRKKYKNKLGEMIQTHFAKKISPMCDLYVYFFFKGLEMLKSSGVMVIISSNSWMNVRFGGDLQKGILRYGQLRYVIENHVQKSFSDAEINTAIAVLHKQKDRGNLTGSTKFISFKKRFEEIKYTHHREIFTTNKDPNLKFLEDDISFQNTDMWQSLSIQNKTLARFGGTVTQSIISSSNQEMYTLTDYKYAKWSVFLLAPKIFYVILNQKKAFSQLDKFCDIHLGSTSGYNPFFYITKEIIDKFKIEPEFLRPLIKSPHDIDKPFENFDFLTKFTFLVSKKKDEIQNTGALDYIQYGENLVPPIFERPFFKASNRNKDNWYHLAYKNGKILLPNLIDVYHKICFLEESEYCVDKKLICATPYTIKWEKIIFVILYSTLTIFFQEICGSTNLGAGALEVNVSDYRNLPFIDLEQVNSKSLKKLEDLFEEIPNDPFVSTFEIFGDDAMEKFPIKKQVDEIILQDILGLSKTEIGDFYESLQKIIQNRKSRSKSTL